MFSRKKPRPIRALNLKVERASQATDEAMSKQLLIIRGEAEGAPLKIGDFVEKCNSNEGDSYPDGTRGLVLSSHEFEGHYGYFVIFTVERPLPVFILDDRIKRIDL